MFFSFKTVDIGDIEKENSINPKKATTSNSIPPKIFKKSSKVSPSVLHKMFNDSIEKSDCLQNLKLDDITPVCKKNNPLDKTNYRPISALPVVSKMFEKINQEQINDFIITFLSPYLCAYTQHALLQKQPPRGVPRKRCSENMQEIYRRTPIFRTPFPKSTSVQLLLKLAVHSSCKGLQSNFLLRH